MIFPVHFPFPILLRNHISAPLTFLMPVLFKVLFSLPYIAIMMKCNVSSFDISTETWHREAFISANAFLASAVMHFVSVVLLVSNVIALGRYFT